MVGQCLQRIPRRDGSNIWEGGETEYVDLPSTKRSNVWTALFVSLLVL